MYYQTEHQRVEILLSSHKLSVNKDIFDGNFHSCKLEGEDLSNAYLPYGKFYKGNLRLAQLQNAILGVGECVMPLF